MKQRSGPKKNRLKKQALSGGNYLERHPMRASALSWSTDSEGIVTLDMKNTGVFNRAAQKLLGKPEISRIRLDPIGSFLWPMLDGTKDMIWLGEQVHKRFGKGAEPLYERLARYFQTLESYHLIAWADHLSSGSHFM